MSSLTISLSRTELPGSLPALVLSGSDDANAIGVRNYVRPARVARVGYAPPSKYVHSDAALSGSLALALLQFDVVTDQATSETASRASLALLEAALGQFAFTATVTVNGATAEVWSCNMGSIVPVGSRTEFDMAGFDPTFSVSIPCHPIPS